MDVMTVFHVLDVLATRSTMVAIFSHDGYEAFVFGDVCDDAVWPFQAFPVSSFSWYAGNFLVIRVEDGGDD